MAAKKRGKIDKALDKAVNDLLKEVTLDKKELTGDYDKDNKAIQRQKYTLTDVMKVIGAKIKLEAIRLKADDAGYGSGFGDEIKGDDD